MEELKSFRILSGLADDEVAALKPRLRQSKSTKGGLIVAEGAGDRTLYLLLNGSAHVTISSHDAKEVIISQLADGDFFGELSLITGNPRSANVVAMTNCTLLTLTADDFLAHTQKHSGLALALLRELAERLAHSSKKIADLALYDVYERVYRTLQRLAEPNNDGGQFLPIRPTHQELANMVGTSREMVTRTLLALEEEGRIRLDGKSIRFS